MNLLLYILHLLALMLVPAFMLVGAEVLMVAPEKVNYHRLLMMVALSCLFAGVLWIFSPILAFGVAFFFTLILVRVKMDILWGDAFLMTLFGGLCGGIFALSSHLILTPLISGDVLMEDTSRVIVVPLTPRKTVEYTALDCIDFARTKVTKSSPDMLFYKLIFSQSITHNGDGKSDYCEVYFIDSNGLMWLVVLNNGLIAFRVIESDVELNRQFYEGRENPVVMNSVDILTLLQADSDFSTFFNAYFQKNSNLFIKDLVSFVGIFYDEAFGRYIWQVTLGERNTPDGKMVFSLDSATGEVLDKKLTTSLNSANPL
jgi:hypothetical protein